MKRIYFLDHLRSLMILLVIVYHTQFIFTSGLLNSWVIISETKSENLGLIGMYLDTFVMFTFFYIAGFFIAHSAKNNNYKELIRSKLKRIILPWLFGILIIIPIYKILFLFNRGLPQEEWFSYFHFYKRIGTDLSLFSNDPNQNWLWFLPVLFLFQMCYLLLHRFKLLNNNLSISKAIAYTFILSIAYSMLISKLGLKGWTLGILLDFQNERLLPYLLFFLLGTKSYQLEHFSKPLSKTPYIVSNIIISIGITIYTIVGLNLFYNIIDPTREYYFISSFGDRLVYYSSIYLCTFSFMHILIYPYFKYLNRPINWMKTINRNSYYIYIVHMVVMGIVAIPVLKLGIPNILSYFTIILLTFIGSHLLVNLYYSVKASLFDKDK